MNKFLIILLFVIGKQASSQLVVSIDSLSGFSCFDSISELNVWRKHKIYFPDSTVKEDIRFRIWGDGCILNHDTLGERRKCFYKFQRQTYFETDKIEEKEGVYGWYNNSSAKSIYHQMIYNKKGRLLYVQKVKRK